VPLIPYPNNPKSSNNPYNFNPFHSIPKEVQALTNLEVVRKEQIRSGSNAIRVGVEEQFEKNALRRREKGGEEV